MTSTGSKSDSRRNFKFTGKITADMSNFWNGFEVKKSKVEVNWDENMANTGVAWEHYAPFGQSTSTDSLLRSAGTG